MQMEVLQMAEMHSYLTGFDKYNVDFPFYVDDLFSQEDISELRSILNENRKLEPFIIGDKIEDGYIRQSNFRSRFQPKIAKNMSRMLLEFDMPKHLEEKLDKIAKPTYKGDIALCHYNYIEYDLKHGYGDNSPSLAPHLDADENLVTINYCLDTNIEWDLYISDSKDSTKYNRYSLKAGQAVIFSAVNQIHWRPKRKFKNGEFCEIISMDYCPTTNYKFLGEDNPIDPEKHPERRKAYLDELQSRKDMQGAFMLWNEEGFQDGIPQNSMG